MDEIERITAGFHAPAPAAVKAAMEEIAEVFAYGHRTSPSCSISAIADELQYHYSDRLLDPPLHLPDAARWGIRSLIEAGMLEMSPSDNEVTPTSALWQWRQSGFPSVQAQSRDEWLCNLATQGVGWKEIHSRFSKAATSRGWDTTDLSSGDSVRKAVNRYAKKHSVNLPVRKSGRPLPGQ